MKKSRISFILLCCVILGILIVVIIKFLNNHIIFEPEGITNTDKENLRGIDMEYINSINNFAYNSSEYILSQNDGKSNYLYSPLSAFTALSVLSEVTEGNTKDQICKSIGYIHLDNLKSEPQTLISNLCFNNGNKSLTDMGNSIWLDKKINFNNDLLRDLSKKYNLSSYKVSFGTRKSSRQMSSWVNKNTNSFMKLNNDAFSSNADNVLQIINTLHVKDRWTDPFEADATYIDTFNINEDNSVECNYMNKIMYDFSLYEDEKFIMFKLPFENIGEMVFMKPKDNITTQDIVDNIEFLINANENINTVARLSIPKFKFNYKINLREMLMSLGIEEVFTQQSANFTPITDEGNLFVNKIEQFSGIEVNEYGCEAASYTRIVGATSPLIQTDIKLNEPFVFSIVREKIILYVGIVNDPTK